MKNENEVLKLIIESGLYIEINIETENKVDELIGVYNGNYSVNLYCYNCEENSIFQGTPKEEKVVETPPPSMQYRMTSIPAKSNYEEKIRIIEMLMYQDKTFPYMYLELPCVRCGVAIVYCMKYNRKNKSIIKIGQYPSIVDLAQDIDKKYEKLLSKEYFREYKEAVRLFSHGVGIGAFVYLRRIIDKLILDTFRKNSTKIDIDEDEYRRLRFDDKIDYIKDYLSPAVKELLSSSYSILSKGIHELGEEECKLYFEPLKLVIKVILDEEIRKEQEKKEQLELKQSIARIKTELT